jgi:hypothetical protein
MTLRKPRFETLTGVREAFAAHSFSDDELSELVDPKFGIITGFADLMAQLEILRSMDLGTTPPALGINSTARDNDT